MPIVSTMQHEYILKFLAEMIGTAMLVFFGCSGCIEAYGHKPTLIDISLNAGFGIMISITIFGFFSGSFINPAVTVGAMICQVLPLTMGAVYICAEIVGAFLGYGLLLLLTPAEILTSNPEVCLSMPNVSSWNAVAVEFVLTGVLVLICCAVWEPTNRSNRSDNGPKETFAYYITRKFDRPPALRFITVFFMNHRMDSCELKFAFGIACLIISGGKFTGSNMNPARSLAPAIWNNNYTSQWVYWVGPLAGAAAASTFYKMFFWKTVQLKRVKTADINLDAA